MLIIGYRAGRACRWLAVHKPPNKIMKSHFYLTIFTILAALCFTAMAAVTAIWMYVPIRIVYQESSPAKTELYSIEVRQHGQAYYVTPKQKYLLDLVRNYTAIIWFGCFGYLFLFTAFGGFARLRLLQRQRAGGGSPP